MIYLKEIGEMLIFSLKFANLYPEQYIYLYACHIQNDCKHIQKYLSDEILTHLPLDVVKILEDKQQSKVCIRKVYSLIDTTFSNIFNELSKEQFYSFLGQIAYIHLLLKENSYIVLY